jgi:hypothetical protein
MMRDENNDMSHGHRSRLKIWLSVAWRLSMIEATGRIEICILRSQAISGDSNISEKIERPVRTSFSVGQQSVTDFCVGRIENFVQLWPFYPELIWELA